MKVYRLEHKDSGLGPFEHNNGQQSIIEYLIYHDDPHDHLSPVVLESVMNDGWIYGWKNRELIRKFVKPGRQKLVTSHGFIIKRYEPTTYIMLSDGQVIFDPEFEEGLPY